MHKILFVGLGGFCGAIMRYAVGHWTRHLSTASGFPVGTLAVNLLGCFLIGMLSIVADTHQWMSPTTRSFLMIGFLGAFTTFSTFGLESHDLFHSAGAVKAGVNVGLHVVAGMVCIVLGRAAATAVG